jgi:two-component system OmpR family response regulator
MLTKVYRMLTKHTAIAPYSGERPSKKMEPVRRILVVDDEPHIRQLCADALAYSGYHVDSAEDGVAAWERLQNNVYDLLVTDNNMCRLTGIGLIKKLRAARMALPVIMVSGAMPTDELDRHPWLRIDASLHKPFTVDELVGTVREVLRVTEDARQPITVPMPHWQSQPSADGLRL